jgi:hypothetical protein
MTMTVVRLLGVFAIAHALSHTILPLRGSFQPAYEIRDYIPIILYIVCTTGFLAAGMGLLGLRVLNMFISPLLVLSAVLSCVAVARLGDMDLVGGALLNVVFFVVGLWRGYAGWPEKDAVEVDYFDHLGTPTSR